MQVTLSEATRLLKISDKTARRWLRNGKLQGSQVTTDRGVQWMVILPDNLPPPEDPSGELEALREMNKLLSQELTAKNEQIRELHILLQGLQGALSAPQPTQRPPWWRFWHRRY